MVDQTAVQTAVLVVVYICKQCLKSKIYALNIQDSGEFIVFVEFGDREHEDVDEFCIEPCLFLKFLEIYSDATPFFVYRSFIYGPPSWPKDIKHVYNMQLVLFFFGDEACDKSRPVVTANSSVVCGTIERPNQMRDFFYEKGEHD